MQSSPFLLSLAACLTSAAVLAQQPPPPDIDQLIREGKTAALEAKLSGGRTADELRWMARAWANAAEQALKPAEREERFAEAEKRYRKWVAAVESGTAGDEARRGAETAAARMETAMLLLQRWGGPDIDELEVSSGERGDLRKAQRLLEIAAADLEKAEAAIRPLNDNLAAHEESLFAAGLYDAALRMRFEVPYYLARARLYQGMFETRDGERRAKALRAAEALFQQLAGNAPEGAPLTLARVGLGMVFREQKRFAEAEAELKRAIGKEEDKAAAAQARFELGRTQVAAGKYSEARATLEPLVRRHTAQLSEEEKPATFYFNCARLWDGLSYIQEAEAIRKQGGPAAATADQVRASGTARLTALGQEGGPWPAIVQVYVLAAVDVDADPKSLEPQQLLFVAQKLSEQNRAADAAARLKEAAARPTADLDLRARILFEWGMTEYKLGNLRAAAGAFETLAAQVRSHALAPQAAANAFSSWARIADQSKDPKDYERLAAVLLNLVQSYPDHQQRVEAMWWLPVALQAAGRYTDAVEQFGNVPKNSPRFEEAQFRRVVCQRLELEATREALAPPQYAARGKQVAERLLDFAQKALERAKAGSGDETRKLARWSAEARVNASELLASSGVEQYQPALAALEQFEQQYAGTSGEDLIGRAIGARIRAHRGLRQFEQAARAVQSYLEAVPADRAGPVLTLVAQGMQEELERLRSTGRHEEARTLAREAVPTFQELEKWCRSDPQRAADAKIVSLGLAGVHFTAGQLDEAAAIIDRLLKAEPNNGSYRRLHALILTERAAAESAPSEQVEAARSAWARLLGDPGLRSKAPERYWEARYNVLRLTLRLGRAAEVEKAIRQERVWYPDLGGPAWKPKFDALYDQVAAQAPPGDAAGAAPRK